MKMREWNFAFALRPLDAHDRFERGERHVHIAWVRCDALLALAENRVNAIVTLERAATAAGIAFVALRKGRVVKIIATRPLHQVAADRRHVPQLRTGAREQRLAQ